MDISDAMNIFVELEPEESKLKNKLKGLRAKLRPAKKAITQHIIDNNLSSLEVGKTIFKLKKTKDTKFNKKRFEDSKAIPEQAKQKYIQNNTEESIKITATQK